MALTLLAAVVLVAHQGPIGMERYSVLPSDTDPAIHEFNDPHLVFVDPSAKPRNQLLVFLPGTNGKPGRTDAFSETAAGAGYFVIDLMYPDTISATTINRSPDPDAFLNFRLEIIEGRDTSKAIEVDRANSIENRLIKLLQYLDQHRPAEHWGMFLTAEGQPKWESIAMAGLSQGAGHAGLIAVRHGLARAILFGGPKDFDRATGKPAAWYTAPATPIQHIFTFNHEQDHQGCNFAEQVENCSALGLDKLGGPVNVDDTPPPFKNSHILSTNYPGAPVTSLRAHVSVVGDGLSPKTKDGVYLFRQVWLYMLTADQP